MTIINDILQNDYPFLFSICTIVNNFEEYNLMKNSFEEKQFSNDCEYIIADNSKENKYDAYQAIRNFLKIAKGKYILIIHQDVRAIDNKTDLQNCLQNLDLTDENWAVCGNAGVAEYHQSYIYISDPSQTKLAKNLPKKVKSLDENFLIIKNESNVTISANLTGFHLYGTDLCIIAHFLGYTCYVIPFMVKHLSKGNLNDLQVYKPYFIKKYGDKFNVGYVETTCTKFYLSNSVTKNKFYNNQVIFFIIKQLKRLPYLLKSKL